MGVGDGEDNAALFYSFGYLLCLLICKGQHLFSKDVFPGLCRGHEHLGVLAGGGGHGHALYGGVGKDGVKVRLEGHPQLLGHLCAALRVAVPKTAEGGIGVFLEGGGILHGVHMPRAQDCNVHNSFLLEKIYGNAGKEPQSLTLHPAWPGQGLRLQNPLCPCRTPPAKGSSRAYPQSYRQSAGEAPRRWGCRAHP